jgi:SAM-dependent methyltransferase
MRQPMSEREDEAWWEHYFDEAFIRLYRPFLTPGRTAREAAGAAGMLELQPGGAVLDLACGWGRHAVAMARMGFRVTGVDASAVLLRHGAEQALAADVEVEWVRADVRDLSWADRFDAVVCLFSSLGYFLSDEEDLRALRAARDALKPGGRFLLETMHRDLVAREYVEHDWWTGEGGEHVWVEREFDAVAGVSHEWLRWRGEDGEDHEKYHAVRVRSATEWDALLRRAGLLPLGWYGSWKGREFAPAAPRLIVLAERPRDP